METIIYLLLSGALLLQFWAKVSVVLVSSAAVIWVVTQRFSPTKLVGKKRCVTTQITAAEETTVVFDLRVSPDA